MPEHTVTIGYISNIYYDMSTSLRDALLSADSVATHNTIHVPIKLVIFIVGKYNKEVGVVTKPHNFHYQYFGYSSTMTFTKKQRFICTRNYLQ